MRHYRYVNDFGYEVSLAYTHYSSRNMRILIYEYINSVHQLQNLYFALTGKELTINE